MTDEAPQQASPEPYAVYQTRQEFDEAMLHFVGERVARAQRAVRRAENRAAAAEEEAAELRRELHRGTPLYPGGANPDAKAPK